MIFHIYLWYFKGAIKAASIWHLKKKKKKRKKRKELSDTKEIEQRSRSMREDICNIYV